MEIMTREPLCDSKLETIMLKFRPIAPKPPTRGGAPLAADPDGAGTGLTRKRRRGGRKPRRITPSLKKLETGAMVSPPPTASVTVERVTAAGTGAASGEDIRRRLEADASPCFVSDSADRVTGINAAFRKMVLCEESSSSLHREGLIRVELVTRGMAPRGEWRGFSCLARVRMGEVAMVAPCDVWKVEEGKWAWRLDVATALGLGLSCA